MPTRNTASRAPFRYRGFWDVPRMIVLRHSGRLLLLDSPFSDEFDGYESTYQVYVLPDAVEACLGGSWVDLQAAAERHLGEIPVTEIRFDATRRKTVETGPLDRLLEIRQG
jgi:hypothetical protein